MEFEQYEKSHKNSCTGNHINLYKQLIKDGFEIYFELDETQTRWALQEINSRKFIIIDPDKGENPAGMAHELLHIDLYRKGFKNDLVISQYYNGSNSLFGFLYGERYIPPINNTLAHFKMIDDFLSFGFTIDSFLQVTPEEHFENNVKKDIDCLLSLHDSGMTNICWQTIKFIIYCGTAKLAERYCRTYITNQILQSLQKINKDFIIKLETLFENWINSTTIDNLGFFTKLDTLLKEHAVPNGVDCPPDDGITNFLCNGSSNSIF